MPASHLRLSSLFILFLSNPLPAINITVTTAEDELDTHSSDGSGISLREAIRDAAPGDRIIFDSSVFNDFSANVIILTKGQLVIDKDLTIDGSVGSFSLRNIEINANGHETEHRVMEVRPNSTVLLSGLNITGGRAQDGDDNTGGNGLGGGGIFVDSASLTMTSCNIYGNRAGNGINGIEGGLGAPGGFGGGILLSSGSNLNLSFCILRDNQSGSGGDGSDSGNGFTGGEGRDGGDGGAICAFGGNSITLSECAILNNKTGDGGNGGNGNTNSSDSSRFGGNGGSGGSGSGIAAYGNNSTLSLDRCTIINNKTGNGGDGGSGNKNNSNLGNGGEGGYGGAIHLHSFGSLTINSSTISNNRAGIGGKSQASGGSDGGNGRGGGLSSLSTFNIDIKLSTFSGNSAESGGGLYSNGQAITTTISIDNSTLSDNSAFSDGGGIASNSNNISLINSIVAGNRAPNSPDLREISQTSTSTSGSNLISSLDGQNSLTNATPNLIIADPLLSSLGNYGGSTQVMLPLLGSPAIGAATDGATGSDQRNFPRPSIMFNSRNPGVGAAEAPDWENLYSIDIPFIWNTDFDNDRIPFGLEVAINSDPHQALASDRDKLPSVTFKNATPRIKFGRNINAPHGTSWTLYRSTDFSTFTPIFRFDGSSITESETGNTNIINSTDFEITDNEAPATKAFYRLKAD